jgi:hypothetical protein
MSITPTTGQPDAERLDRRDALGQERDREQRDDRRVDADDGRHQRRLAALEREVERDHPQGAERPADRREPHGRGRP